jgi:hypothetical protein
MTEYPTKKSSIYTENMGLRVEPALKQAFATLKATTSIDVAEAQRIALRDLVKRLQKTAS